LVLGHEPPFACANANANGVESEERGGSDESSLSRRAHLELEGRLEARDAPAPPSAFDSLRRFVAAARPSVSIVSIVFARTSFFA